MRRIFKIVLFAAFATTTFGQKPNEKLRQLDNYLQNQGFTVFHRQSSTWAEGITNEWFTDLLFPKGYFDLNEEQREQFLHQKVDDAIDSIRLTCTSLIKKASQSYLYEIHTKHWDFDSIRYVLYFYHDYATYDSTLEENSDSITKVMKILPYEILDFLCHHNVRNLRHSFRIPTGISWNDMQPFNIAAFEEQIKPVIDAYMAIEGAKAYPVYWQHDAGFKDAVIGGDLVSKHSNSKNSEHNGLTTGTHYFIPLKNREEAEALFNQLDSLAYNYVNSHPEQVYTYHYPKLHLNNTNTLPIDIVDGMEHKNSKGYYLKCMFNSDGFHILSLANEGDLWIPRDWPKHKSYINGVKTYR